MVLLNQLLLRQSTNVAPLKLKGSNSRACLAILLRYQPGKSSSFSFTSLAQLQAYSHESSLESEVLFIKRANNPHDRWANHIGFPGGRANQGEGELAAAKRECLEEIGIDLDSGRFALLCQLDDRLMRTSKPLLISTFLFVQLDTAELDFKLAANEVAEAFWVDSRRLLPPNSLEELSLPLSSIKLNRNVMRMAAILGVHSLRFPCIHLLKTKVLPSQRLTTRSNSKNNNTNDHVGYALWGLSWGITSDLLKVAGLPTLNERLILELGRGSTSAKPFRTNSLVANLLLEAYYTRFPRVAMVVPAVALVSALSIVYISKL